MYAIVRQGGKQYRIAAGEDLVCDRVKGDVGDPFSFEKNLLVSDEGKTLVTNEDLARYEIKAEVIEHFDDKKILVFKYLPKKGYRRTKGHRQSKTRLRILTIEESGGKKTAAKAKATPKTEAKEAPAAKAPAAKAVEATAKEKSAAKPKTDAKPKASKPAAKSEKPAKEA